MVQGLMKDFDVTEPEKYKVLHIFLISLVILFPLCMSKDVTTLRYGTLISIGAVAYSSILLLVELFYFWDTKRASKQIKYFVFNEDFFSAFGITFFAFYCQVNFFPSLENMTKRDKVHIKKVILYFQH